MSIDSIDAPAREADPPPVVPGRSVKAPPDVVATTAPRRKGAWTWWLSLGVLGAAAYFLTPFLKPHLKPHLEPLIQRLSGTAVPTAPPAAKLVPVVTGIVRQGDLPIYINGLGSVTAFYTVTLRPRVDGELTKVLFNEGQMVRKGDLLAEIDPRPFQVQLTEAKGQLNRDEAALWVAKLDLERYTTLRARGSITQQEIDAQTALVKQHQGALQVDQAQIDNAELQLTYSRITAPISGRIGLRTVDPGNMVHAGDLNGLAVITQLQPIALVFTIPQDDIARVQKRMKESPTLTVEAWGRDMQTKLGAGVLQALDNQVDPATGTVRLKAVFANEDELLFPNQFVNARLLVDTRRAAVLAPTAAIQRGPDSAFVYLVDADSVVRPRNVIIGPSEGNETSIETGLASGEVVVTDGIDKLTDGTRVSTRASDGARPGAGHASTDTNGPAPADG